MDEGRKLHIVIVSISEDIRMGSSIFKPWSGRRVAGRPRNWPGAEESGS